MLLRLAAVALVLVGSCTAYSEGAEHPAPLVAGLVNPESVCYGPHGKLYVTEIGEADKAGDGKVTLIDGAATKSFAVGLDDPKGIVFYRDEFYVTDRTKIVKIDLNGQVRDYMTPAQFPVPPKFLNDIAIDVGAGIFLVSDSGDLKGAGGAVFRIDHRLNKIELLADAKLIPELHTPNGVAFDGGACALIADFGTGDVYRVNVETLRDTRPGAVEKIASGIDGADTLVFDYFGRLFITSWKTGKVYGIPRPGAAPQMIAEGLQAAADACLDADGKYLLVPDMKAGTLVKLPTTIVGWEVDDSPAPAALEPAFANLKWTGWDDGSESGKPNPLRPVFLTHAGDGSGRVFVVIQQGTIHTFAGDAEAVPTKIFLDLSKQVRYSDKANEEGLLGFAFHPKFKVNGHFYVYYTDSRAKLANVVSRFTVKKDDPTVGDPASEQMLMRFEKPYDNHNGGTIVFGPDGMLYIAVGDGGAGGDPQRNGQNLETEFGKVLRIDVDQSGDLSAKQYYSSPQGNPFAGRIDAMNEIWCYGLRNPWRIAFDRKTGRLWCGDVGQGLFEEVNILEAGKNYGWRVREGLHPFGPEGTGPKDAYVEPVWEYHHALGPSITGGTVYRGKAIPALDGAYLYGDYVSNRIWALTYDDAQKRVTANRPIKGNGVPIMSFGEDEVGEVYVMGVTNNGRGIFKFVPKR